MFVVGRAGLSVLAVNRGAEAMYGLSDDFLGSPAGSLWPEHERVDLESLLVEAAVAHHRSGPWTHSDAFGSPRNVGIFCAETEYEGVSALLLTVIDLTDDIARERALLEGATRDALTGVSNSARFLDRLRMTVSRAQHEPEYRFAVLYIDLDRFRQINERVGHISADKILAEAGARITAAAGAGDVVARIGGDEFAVLCDVEPSGNDAVKLAERVLVAFQEPFGSGESVVSLSVSIGVVVGGGDPDLQTDAIIRNADAAMHRAKQQGRSRYELFDESLRKKAMHYVKTESELRLGLERGEFALYYQPIVSIPGGEMHGAEALLRWMHPEEGVVAPGGFISVAEESGLIVPMGDWVMHEACRQIRTWQDAGHPEISVSVNVSARQFRDGDVCASLKSAIAEAGIDARHLTAELTESVVMEDPSSSVEIMKEISAMGVGLAMDDFGTGYSSLSYLKQFRFDSLKIDRSFISGIDSSAGDAAIVAAVIALAHSFRSRAVGEGVENPEQLQYLRLLRCDMAQGFLFSRPIPADDPGAMMQRGTLWTGLQQ
jgi:diguanylate cyclase (GGDEF)-like protein